MSDPRLQIIIGDCRETLKTIAADSVQCCVTSPPYWGLRDYGHAGQIGQEKTPQEFTSALVGVFAEVWRVLRHDGTLWLNLGDSYAANRSYQVTDNKHVDVGNNMGSKVPPGLKPKDLVGIPWRVAFALQEAGWYLRSEIIWAKPNPMPESVTDRPTKSHEQIFLLTKQERYYYDAAAIREKAVGPAGGNTKPNKSFEHDPVKHRTKAGLAAAQMKAKENGGFTERNKRTIWTVPTYSYDGAHFATYPPDLIKPCILAGSKAGDTILDPFGGSGTTGEVALSLGRKAILCELNPEYAALSEQRTETTVGLAL